MFEWIKDFRLRWLIWRMSPEQREEYRRRQVLESIRQFGIPGAVLGKEPQAIRFPTGDSSTDDNNNKTASQ